MLLPLSIPRQHGQRERKKVGKLQGKCKVSYASSYTLSTGSLVLSSLYCFRLGIVMCNKLSGNVLCASALQMTTTPYLLRLPISLTHNLALLFHMMQGLHYTTDGLLGLTVALTRSSLRLF